MFLATFNKNNNCECRLYNNNRKFLRDTWNPNCGLSQVIDFKVKGKTYQERKAYLENLAIEFSNIEKPDLSYQDIIDLTNFFEKNGKRYGLLTDFRENGLC